MFNYFQTATRFLLSTNLEQQIQRKLISQATNELQLAAQVKPNLTFQRFKSKKQSKKDSSGSEGGSSQGDKLDQLLDRHTKAVTLTVKTLRIDAFLKSGLGIARNKIETLFYESKIRVNGQKVLKKSALISEGDELDIVKGPSANNPDFLNVARLEVVTIIDTGENINVKVRRSKNLTIDKYPD